MVKYLGKDRSEDILVIVECPLAVIERLS
jgi:hypothetical protein